MFDTILKYLIKFGLFTAVLAALYALGAAVNAFLPWSWLTYFFVIMRHLLAIFAWIIDINTMLIIIGLIYTFKISVKTYDVAVKVFSYFHPHA